MQISVTTRFVDREVLAAKPHDPDAADTAIGTVLTVDDDRGAELIGIGFAVALAGDPVLPSDAVPIADDVAATDEVAPVDDATAPVIPDPSDGGPVDLTK